MNTPVVELYILYKGKIILYIAHEQGAVRDLSDLETVEIVIVIVMDINQEKQLRRLILHTRE